MNTSQLIKFKELLSAINQINGVTSPLTYLFISNDEMTQKKGLSMYDLSNFDYLIVLGEYKWQNGSFINESAKLIGFFDKDLELVESIPLNPEMQLKGIDFTNYPSSYYNEYKPVFICERQNGESLTLKLDNDEGWIKDFVNLFNQAKQL